jgi:hypothetical protein
MWFGAEETQNKGCPGLPTFERRRLCVQSFGSMLSSHASAAP